MHAASYERQVLLQVVAEMVLQWRFEEEMWVCRPVTCSATDVHHKNGTSTFPSAHSNISWSGKLARCMEVVHTHTGKPSKITTAQKERITRPRVFMLFGLSGGGCL